MRHDAIEPVMPARGVRDAWVRWGMVVVYFVATSLGHLKFSLWLVRGRSSRFGDYAFKDAVPYLMVTAAVVLLLWIVHQARKDPEGFRAAGWYWLAWGGCVALMDRYLTYSVNEYAHYPQYALLAWLLARALDPDRSRSCTGRVLFWTTLLGMVDEVQQYVWIAPSYGHYLDFNDFLVNLVAGAGGMMVYYGATSMAAQRPARLPWLELGTASGLALLFALAFAAGRVHLSPDAGQAVPAGGWMTGADGVARLYLQRAAGWYGSWQSGPRHGVYLVLTPAWVAVLMAGGAALFGQFLDRPRRPAQPASE